MAYRFPAWVCTNTVVPESAGGASIRSPRSNDVPFQNHASVPLFASNDWTEVTFSASTTRAPYTAGPTPKETLRPVETFQSSFPVDADRAASSPVVVAAKTRPFDTATAPERGEPTWAVQFVRPPASARAATVPSLV